MLRTGPTISQLGLDIESAGRIWLNETFTLPPGWAGVDEVNIGRRAPDSDIIVRSGDKRSTKYTLTTTGIMSGQTSNSLLDDLNFLNSQLANCRKVWRANRCFVHVVYGVMPPPTMGSGWLSAEVTIVFFAERLGWYTKDGRQVFG